VGFVDPGFVPHSTAPIAVTTFFSFSHFKVAGDSGLEPEIQP
jgi:hypothetical protein